MYSNLNSACGNITSEPFKTSMKH